MRWLIAILVTIILFQTAPAGAALILVFIGGTIAALLGWFTPQPPQISARDQRRQHIDDNLARLVLLQRELARLHAAGRLDSREYERSRDLLQAALDDGILRRWPNVEVRQSELERAWRTFVAQDGATSAPPWRPRTEPPPAAPSQAGATLHELEEIEALFSVEHDTEPKPAPPADTPASFASESRPAKALEKEQASPPQAPLPTKSEPRAETRTHIPSETEGTGAGAEKFESPFPRASTVRQAQRIAPLASTPLSERKEGHEYPGRHAGSPGEAVSHSRMEPVERKAGLWQRVKKMSAEVLLPFLWQNIGWFIGGFMFTSGAIFLVVYTSGYGKALSVLSTLLLYGALLLWGGWQLQRKYTQGHVASTVLALLALTLLPLAYAAATRLSMHAGGDTLLSALAWAGILATLGLGVFASRLGMGMLDRVLVREQARLFNLLAALQLVLPFSVAANHWMVLAGLHGLILLILAFAVWRFAEHWLKLIFEQSRLVTVYIGGLQVYAALVGFLHLTWSTPVNLPAGYAGPFSMAVCALLFYLDIRLQRHAHGNAWLNSFTFVIYALSVTAVLLAQPQQMGIPLLVTLGVAVGLYAAMVWTYLSLPPLYLLLASLGGLYGVGVLRHFPPDWHCLLSIPLLFLLLGLQRLARQRESEALDRVVQRSALLAIPLLTVWSLYHAVPGLIGMATPLTAAALVLLFLGERPRQLLQREDRYWPCYAVPALIVTTLAYAPLILAPWPLQFSLGLWGLGVLWSAWGLSPRHTVCRAAVWFDSGFSVTLAALGVSLYLHPWHQLLPWLALAGGVLWLGHSLVLRNSFFVYLGLIAAGSSVAWLKVTYLGSGVGMGEMLSIYLLAALWWWLERREKMRQAYFAEAGIELPVIEREPRTLLGVIPLAAVPTRAALLLRPLAQVTVLVWLAGLWRLAETVWTAQGLPGPVWGAAALVGALATVVLAVRLRQAVLLPPALLLGAGGLAAFIAPLWLPVVINIFMLAAWLFSLALAGFKPLALRERGRGEGEQSSSSSAPTRSPLPHPSPIPEGEATTSHAERGSENEAFVKECAALVYASGFVLILLADGYAVWQALFGSGSLQAFDVALFTLLAGALFFALSGWHYRRLFHSYLVIAHLLAVGTGFTALLFHLDPLELGYLAGFITILAGGALVLAVLAEVLRSLPPSGRGGEEAKERFVTRFYAAPVQHTALLLFTYALFDSVWHFAIGWRYGFSAWLPWNFVLLAAAVMVLCRPWRNAGEVRGLALPALIGMAVACVVPGLTPGPLLLLGFVLWGMAAFAVPAYNRALPGWTIDAEWWPVFGLLAVIAGVGLYGEVEALPLAVFGVYLLLLTHDYDWPWLPWAAVAALTGSGLAAAWLISTDGFITVLAGTALMLAIFAEIVRDLPQPETGERFVTRFSAPLQYIALLLFTYALLDSLWHFAIGWRYGFSAWLPWNFMLLAAAVMVLCRPWRNAGEVRGLALPALIGMAVACVVPGLTPGPLLLLGFVLWGMAAFAVPAYNRALPGWTIDAEWWPMFGLLVVIAGVGLYGEMEALPLAVLGVYLLLLTHDYDWPWLPWGAVAALTGSGLVAAWLVLVERYASPDEVQMFLWAAFVWLNLLMHLPRAWARWEGFAPRMRERLAAPLFYIPALPWLGLLILLWGGARLRLVGDAPPWSLISSADYLIFAALWINVLSFLHIFLLKPKRITSHFLILALLPAMGLLLGQYLHLPSIFTVWTFFLGITAYLSTPAPEQAAEPVTASPRVLLHRTLWWWLPLSMGIALLVLLNYDKVPFGERLLMLGMLALLSLGLGVITPKQHHVARWQGGGLVLLFILIHLLWFYAEPSAEWPRLLPWFALQDALLAWLVLAVRWPRLDLSGTSPLLSGIAALAWSAHVLTLLSAELEGHSLALLWGGADYFAAMVAALLLSAWALRRIRNEDGQIYAAVACLTVLGLYLRFVWLGAAPPSAWDTALIIGGGYGLLILNYLRPSPALYRLTVGLPLLALFTLPLHTASLHASLALVASGVLYLSIRREQEQTWPLYLGLLALNLGIYLWWVPLLAAHSGLLQLYVVPAALTVLLMLHLHHFELRPDIRHGVRLAALGTLYAAATLDVFLQPGLGIFVLALGLSLAGVVLGIALRVRAFLYTGTAALVLNVVGQLIQFYPEAVLGKAIVLMVLGGLITAGMIVFSLRREEIITRLQAWRSDLGRWE